MAKSHIVSSYLPETQRIEDAAVSTGVNGKSNPDNQQIVIVLAHLSSHCSQWKAFYVTVVVLSHLERLHIAADAAHIKHVC